MNKTFVDRGLNLFNFENLETVSLFEEQSVQRIDSGNPNLKGRINMIDLLVPTSLDQLLFILKLYFSFFTKQPLLMRRSTALSLPLQKGFPE
jgi:hypothetical protein